MQNKIRVKNCEARGKYNLVTTNRGNRFGDWRGDEPLEIDKEYAIEWEFGGGGKYKNITYVAPIEKAIIDFEEI